MTERWATPLGSMGDSYLPMIRRCIPLRCMHPRLQRVVPFRDMASLHAPTVTKSGPFQGHGQRGELSSYNFS